MSTPPDGWDRLRRLPGVDTPIDDGEWAGDRRAPRPPVTEPAPQPAAPRPSRTPRSNASSRRRRWITIAAFALVVLLLLVPLWGYVRFRQIDRVDLADVLSAPTTDTRTLLLVGSDSRADVDPDREDADALLGAPVAGQRADAMLVVRVDADGVSMISIPRDLWVRHASGGEQRINAAYNDGAAELVATVQGSLGIPIHHYAEVDFSGFDELVDAVGGVTIDVPHPAFDPGSGLVIETAGPTTLDGISALAYVRARRYTEIVDGQERRDPTGDIGRTARQQAFMAALFAEMTSTRNPFAVDGVLAGLGNTITIDSGLGLWDAFSLGRQVGGSEIVQVALPVDGFVTSGGAAVLRLGAGADDVLDGFRAP